MTGQYIFRNKKHYEGGFGRFGVPFYNVRFNGLLSVVALPKYGYPSRYGRNFTLKYRCVTAYHIKDNAKLGATGKVGFKK